MINPYRTAPGSDPPELAGREGELGAARYAIDMTKSGAPANPIVLTGLRGMGKTALLRRVAREVEDANGVAILAEADRSMRFADVMRRELGDALKRSKSLPSRLVSSITRVIEKLPRLTYEIPHDAGSVSFGGDADDANDDITVTSDVLEELLLVLNDQLRRHGRFLTIALDEVQESPSQDLLHIVRVVHRTAGTAGPIFFVGAGLPNSATVLKDVRTYTERWAYFRLELLGHEETFEAIDIPARELGVRWSREALEEIYVRTHGYPYFVQEYASAAWLRAAPPNITLDDVLAIAPGVQRTLDESIYDRQFAQLSPRETIYVLALYELGPGIHHAEELATALDTKSSALSSIRTQLIKKDLIYAPSRALMEFRMPLTGDYIERHKSALTKRASLGSNSLNP